GHGAGLLPVQPRPIRTRQGLAGRGARVLRGAGGDASAGGNDGRVHRADRVPHVRPPLRHGPAPGMAGADRRHCGRGRPDPVRCPPHTDSGLRGRAWLRTPSPRIAGLFDPADRVRTGTAALWLVAYGLTWLVLGAAFATFVGAFVDGMGPHARHFAGTIAAAYLSGYLFLLAPAGVGVREGVMTALLAQVVPTSAAIVIAVASRLWFTAAELLPLAALPWLREPVRANHENREFLETP